MNLSQNDIDIMRALAEMLPSENPSENNIAVKTKAFREQRLSTPTVRRRLQSVLTPRGWVHKSKKRGKQRSNLYRLRIKGLFYLLLHNDLLTDKRIDTITKLTINALAEKGKGARSLLKFLRRDEMAKKVVDTIEEMKSRISFDFFDEDYATNLFIDTLFENTLGLGPNLENYVKNHGNHEMLAVLRAWKRDPVVRSFLTHYFKDVFGYVKKQKKHWNGQFRQWRRLMQLWKTRN